jgi:omega-amidase
MHVALVSLDQRWLDKDANFARCREFTVRAAGLGCRLIVFPEMTLTGYSLDPGTSELERESHSLNYFSELAQITGMEIVFGAFLAAEENGRPRNVLCHAGPRYGAFPLYAKMHPFTFAGEDKAIEPGDKLVTFQVDGLRIGCSICYDLRFPEMYSMMAPDCDAIINIANWPARRVAHWRSLLVARSIENQLFMFGVNRIGCDGNNLNYEKSSMVVSPEGIVLQPVHSESELDIYAIDPGESLRYRSAFPAVRDKRFNLYHELLTRYA